MKPDALENVHMTFVQTVVEMVELIPELHESDEIDDVDSVGTWSYHCDVIILFHLPVSLVSKLLCWVLQTVHFLG
jgi:hypothetical protein